MQLTSPCQEERQIVVVMVTLSCQARCSLCFALVQMFQSEYKHVCDIARCPKPYISICQGESSQQAGTAVITGLISDRTIVVEASQQSSQPTSHMRHEAAMVRAPYGAGCVMLVSCGRSSDLKPGHSKYVQICKGDGCPGALVAEQGSGWGLASATPCTETSGS